MVDIFDEIEKIAYRALGAGPLYPLARAGRSKLDDFINQSRNSRRSKEITPRSGMQQRTQPPQQQESQLGELYETLLGLLTTNQGVNPDALMAQTRSQIDPIYDARRQDAESRTARGREDVESLYSDLSGDYKETALEQEEFAQQDQQAVEQLYGELRKNMEGNYARISEEQEEMFSQLGIEEAAPEVMAPQGEQALASMNRADELGAINEQRYEDIGNIDRDYYSEGAPLANLTGTNRSSDMLFELESFLNNLESERAAAINQQYGSALSSQQGRADQMQMQQADMLWNILQRQLDATQQEPQEMTPDLFLGMLPPNTQQGVAEAYRSIERSEGAVTGQTPGAVPGTYVSTPDAWWLEQASRMYEEGAIDKTTYDALSSYIRMIHEMPQIPGY